MEKFKNGDYAGAAELMHRAFALDPKHFDYLYSAARAEQDGRMLDEAERDFVDFLKEAPATHRRSAEAQVHLAEVREAHRILRAQAWAEKEAKLKQEAADAEEQDRVRRDAQAARDRERLREHAEDDPVGRTHDRAKPFGSLDEGTHGQPAAKEWRGPVGLVLGGLGGLLAVVGYSTWNGASADEAALQASVAPGTQPTRTYTDAQVEAGRIETRYRMGIGVGLCGVGVAAVGLLVLPGKADSIAVAPTPTGFTIGRAW